MSRPRLLIIVPENELENLLRTLWIENEWLYN